MYQIAFYVLLPVPDLKADSGYFAQHIARPHFQIANEWRNEHA